jgi:small multidrug resistance pump
LNVTAVEDPAIRANPETATSFMPPLALLALAILGEVIGTSALKASEGFSKLSPSLLVFLSYAISFYLLSLVLKTIPVGIAYAIWSGGGILLVTIAAWLFYGQRPDGFAILGMSLILAGVLVLNLLSKTTSH